MSFLTQGGRKRPLSVLEHQEATRLLHKKPATEIFEDDAVISVAHLRLVLPADLVKQSDTIPMFYDNLRQRLSGLDHTTRIRSSLLRRYHKHHFLPDYHRDWKTPYKGVLFCAWYEVWCHEKVKTLCALKHMGLASLEHYDVWENIAMYMDKASLIAIMATSKGMRCVSLALLQKRHQTTTSHLRHLHLLPTVPCKKCYRAHHAGYPCLSDPPYNLDFEFHAWEAGKRPPMVGDRQLLESQVRRYY